MNALSAERGCFLEFRAHANGSTDRTARDHVEFGFRYKYGTSVAWPVAMRGITYGSTAPGTEKVRILALRLPGLWHVHTDFPVQDQHRTRTSMGVVTADQRPLQGKL